MHSLAESARWSNWPGEYSTANTAAPFGPRAARRWRCRIVAQGNTTVGTQAARLVRRAFHVVAVHQSTPVSPNADDVAQSSAARAAIKPEASSQHRREIHGCLYFKGMSARTFRKGRPWSTLPSGIIPRGGAGRRSPAGGVLLGFFGFLRSLLLSLHLLTVGKDRNRCQAGRGGPLPNLIGLTGTSASSFDLAALLLSRMAVLVLPEPFAFTCLACCTRRACFSAGVLLLKRQHTALVGDALFLIFKNRARKRR